MVPIGRIAVAIAIVAGRRRPAVPTGDDRDNAR